MEQWYYMLNSERRGPVAQSEIETLLATGQLSLETMVWSQQLTDWTPAAKVPAFANLQRVPAAAAVARAEQSAPAAPTQPPSASPAPQPASAEAESDNLKNLIKQQSAAKAAPNAALLRNEHFYAGFLKNAYRVLGITGSASQQELKKTTANIRRQAKVGKAYTTAVDLAWIGAQVSREEKDLLDAETRLLNPDTRVKERLLWFHSVPEGFPAQMTVEEATSTAQNVFKSSDPVARHDAAVLMQFAAIAGSPECENPELWNQALSMWRAVQKDEDYWTALCEIDDKLGFEPVCLASDVLGYRDKLIDLVTEPIVLLSKDALNSGNQALFARAAALINTGGGTSQGEGPTYDSSSSSEIAEEFHRMMNGYYEEIGQLIEGIDRKEKTYKASRPKTIDTCGRCEILFDYEVQKLLDNAKAALPESSPDLAHLREAGATILEMIGGGWTWADDYVNAIKLLERAEDLAANTAVEPKIRETLDNYRKSLEMQKMFGEQKKVNSAPLLFTMNACGFMFYPAMGEEAEPYLGSKRGIYYLVVLFLPIFPLASYRAIFHPNGSYSFLSRIPLDKWARIHQAVIVLPIVSMFLFAALYKPSPEELARRQAAETQRIEANTNAAIARAKKPVALPSGKYDLKDLVNNDDEALEDLKGRLEREKPQLEQIEAELTAEAAAIREMKAQKNPDKKTLQSRIDAIKAKIAAFDKRSDTYNSTFDLAKKILEERNKAADTYNSIYARR